MQATVPRIEPARQRFALQLALNVIALAVPFACSIVAIPLLLQNLGATRFGALSLLLAAFAYVSVLDFGLGAAITYRVSALLAREEDVAAVRPLLRTATLATLGVGAVIGLALYHAAPWMPRLFDFDSSAMADEAVEGLRILALSVPFVFAAGLFAGLLSGFRRFNQVNAVRIAAGILTALGPALASFWWADLVTACVVLAAVRIATSAVHLFQCRALLRHIPPSAHLPPSAGDLRPLLHFGGWLTVSNIASPFMMYMDRFYLAAVGPVEEVSHYVAPYELAMKLLLLPAGVLPLLFPRLVEHWARGRDGSDPLPIRLAAATALGCALPAAALALVAPELVAWIGHGQLPAGSAQVLQILVGASLVNCIAQVFYLLVQARGATARIAQLHLAELVLYALALWWLTTRFGILGVAGCWALRIALDAVLLGKLAVAGLPASQRREAWHIVAMTLAFGSVLAAMALSPSLSWRMVLLLVGLVGFALAWRALPPTDWRAAFPPRHPPA